MNALARFLPAAPVPVVVRARDPRIAEALARLEVAVELRDVDAAGRALDSLASDAGGVWLLRQMSAAVMRGLADAITRWPAE